MSWLKEIRVNKHYTQQQVADHVFISLRYYQYLEKGQMKPQVDTAKSIAALLGFEWTLFFKENEK